MSEPLLAAEQWKVLEGGRGVRIPDHDGDVGIAFTHPRDGSGRGVTVERQDASTGIEQVDVYHPSAVRVLIAVANAALPSDDPRKITREMIENIRQAGDYSGGHFAPDGKEMMDALIARIADALEAYLPPSPESGENP
jgi:hypothetical protein